MSSQQSSRGSAYSSTASSPYQHASYYYDVPAQATWMKVIPIEDDELTFGGKPLSDWHEEDLRRYSSSSFDSHDEHRGRTRQRAYYEPTSAATSGAAPTSSGHHHHHKHGHGHKHHHKKSDKKK